MTSPYLSKWLAANLLHYLLVHDIYDRPLPF